MCSSARPARARLAELCFTCLGLTLGTEYAETPFTPQIWEEEEVVAEPLTVDASDSRVQPEYEIMYKQDVSTMVISRCVC